MDRLKKVLWVYLVFIPSFVWAQNWQALSTGVNRQLRCMYADTLANKLYVGKNTAGSGFNCLNVWDGSTWDTLGHIEGAVYSICKFQGDIVAANGYVLQWDGFNWNTLGLIPANGVISLYNDNDNNLYATGWFDSIGGIAASRVAKWNGFIWNAIDTSHWIGGAIYCSIIYNGELYIGGNFWDNAGVYSRIARWDGTQWRSPGIGIVGSSTIQTMKVYNNELYVAGNFTKAAGNTGDNIQKWDGTQWTEVGGGITGFSSISYLETFNGNLYASGNFVLAGGVPVLNIAKWDGTNWCGLGYNGTGASIGINSMAVLNDELYIGGAFTAIDGVPMNYVSKWTGGNYTDTCGHSSVGILEPKLEDEPIAVFPNPTQSILSVAFSANLTENRTLEIKNTLGQTMQQLQLAPEIQKTEIDVSRLPSGLYFLEIKTKSTVLSKKFSKIN